MQVTVARVHDNLFAGEAVSVSVPTTDGVLTILPKHEAFVSTLQAGKVIVRLPAQAGTGAGEQEFDVEGGVLEVSNNQVTVLL